jgi:glycosyltransferase involved in cell wall biosynthesis
LKVLHIGKYFSPFNGGIENYMRDAMVALARRGIDSVALVHQHRFSVFSQKELYRAGDQEFQIVRTGLWARLLYTPLSPAFLWQLKRLVKSSKPDILHLHLPNPSAFWALVLPAARRIPWVVHWHSDVIISAQNWKMKLFYKAYRPFERALLKRANSIVATSSAYRESSLPLKDWLSKCQVVPLGVDVSRFTPNGISTQRSPQLSQESFSKPDNDGQLRVLAVGRLTYYKGFSYLLEAVSLAPGIHVDLVGDGEEAQNLKTLASSLNIQDRVSFHGVLSDSELKQQMMDCDCLCLPSIERTEAFGMVLLEAMYFGKATVIGDVEGSGMGDVVDADSTGIKVKPADANALASALTRLAINPEELASMGLRGKQKFEKKYEINFAVKKLVNIYQQITAGNS